MRALIFLLPLIGILLVSGCTGSTTGGLTGSLAGGDIVQDGGNAQLLDEAAATVPEQADAGSGQAPQDAGVYLDVVSVETDKDMYHSAEVMKLTAVILAGEDVAGATVSASGLNGRLTASRTVDLIEGGNTVELEQQLPTCNRCGGIPADSYTCTLSVSAGESSSSETFIVEIMQ